MKDSILRQAALCASFLLVSTLSEAANLSVGPDGFEDDPLVSSAATPWKMIDLNVTKVVDGQDLGQDFEFGLYQPFKMTTFELGGGGSANFSPWLGFFVTEKAPGSAQLSSIEVTGSAVMGDYHSISWAGPADAPALPGWLGFLSSVVPDNGAGGVCLAKSCIFDVTFTNVTTEVPIPAAAWLFGSALIGVMAIARRRAQADIA
jgi:hypothetical protein